jgi:hypothetical protein
MSAKFRQCFLFSCSPAYAVLILDALRDMKTEIMKPIPARNGITASITSVMSQPLMKAADRVGQKEREKDQTADYRQCGTPLEATTASRRQVGTAQGGQCVCAASLALLKLRRYEPTNDNADHCRGEVVYHVANLVAKRQLNGLAILVEPLKQAACKGASADAVCSSAAGRKRQLLPLPTLLLLLLLLLPSVHHMLLAGTGSSVWQIQAQCCVSMLQVSAVQPVTYRWWLWCQSSPHPASARWRGICAACG